MKKHNERCPECKKVIESLLGISYDHVKPNYGFDIGTKPDDFKGEPYYNDLDRIFIALQDHRGFRNFVRAKKLPKCDFYIPSPGFVLEFDESQHFTTPRAVAIENYPASFKLGYNREDWVMRCRSLNVKDNDPPFRDEQRAWYDTLRDFLNAILGIPTLRMLPEEAKWCSLDPNSEEDISHFNRIILQKLSPFSIDGGSN